MAAIESPLTRALSKVPICEFQGNRLTPKLKTDIQITKIMTGAVTVKSLNALVHRMSMTNMRKEISMEAKAQNTISNKILFVEKSNVICSLPR